jgi:hypothetical protein
LKRREKNRGLCFETLQENLWVFLENGVGLVGNDDRNPNDKEEA